MVIVHRNTVLCEKYYYRPQFTRLAVSLQEFLHIDTNFVKHAENTRKMCEIVDLTVDITRNDLYWPT